MDPVFLSAKKTYGVESKIHESASLITMEGTKLKLMPGLDLPNPSVKVVSIVGKARMGKSTFLNAIVSKYSQENSVIFATNGGVKHCTFGINYCYIPEQNLLLLDSQGLANGDARHDPALLLFIYLVSNVVIFNDTKILQNEALKLIEPICTFATYIDYDTFVKPTLIFRLSDGKLVENTDENLEQVMEHHPDQYQSIRESIEEVFQVPIRLLKTETLDRKEERFLDNGDYLGLLQEKDNGFDKTITAIMEIVKKSEPRSNILTRLPEIVEQINNNEKITLEKLDVVGLVHKNDVFEWLQTVSPHLKTSIEVDGTESCFQERVVKRQQEVDAKLKEFDKRFKSVSATIKREQKKKLKAELDEPISKAIEVSKEKASLQVKGLVDSLELYKCLLNSDSSSFSAVEDESFKKAHLSRFQVLKTACSNLFSPIKNFYESWVQNVNDDFIKSVQLCRDQEVVERDLVKKFCNDSLNNFDTWTKGKISSLDDVLITNDAFLDDCRAWATGSVIEYINSNVSVRSISLSIQANRLVRSININGQVSSTNHNVVSDIYEEFLSSIKAFSTDNLRSILTEKKASLLYNTIYENPIKAKQLYLKNPEIPFIYDSFMLNVMMRDPKSSIRGHKMPFMTLKTWSSNYEPLYKEAMEELIADGVSPEGSDYKKFIVSDEGGDFISLVPADEFYADADMYDCNIVLMLRDGLRKAYCKKIVSGYKFPTGNY